MKGKFFLEESGFKNKIKKETFFGERFIYKKIFKGKVSEQSGLKKKETTAIPGERFIHKNTVKGKVSEEAGLKK